jgi:protein-S-isoprenylcysteine O-methyltransferase Ste14
MCTACTIPIDNALRLQSCLVSASNPPAIFPLEARHCTLHRKGSYFRNQGERIAVRTLPVAVRAIVYMIGFLSFFVLLALRVRALDRFIQVSLPDGVEILGVGLMIAGGVLGLACVGAFIVRGKGTPAPFDAPKIFVAVGPYRYVRNPMYVGGLLLLLGLGLYEHSVSILLMALTLLLVVHLLVVLYEEPTLRKLFGASYEEYCKSTRRWLPGASSRS